MNILAKPISSGVITPSSATDNAIVRFDETSGSKFQNSGVIIDDSNNISGIVGLTMTGALTINSIEIVGTDGEVNKSAVEDSTTWDDAYSKRVDTWGDGLSYSSQTASVDYNSTNLQITANQINTIQDIASSSSPTFTNLTLSGASILANATASGILTLGGTGGTNNENLKCNFESVANRVVISSGTDARPRFDVPLYMNADIPIVFHNSVYAEILWETEGNDNLQIGTKVGNALYSGYISIMEQSDLGNANRSPSSVSANPVLRIYSSDANEANDYIEMYHNQSDGVINSGSGQIILNTPDGVGLGGTIGGVGVWALIPNTNTDQCYFGTRDDVGNQLVIGTYGGRYNDFDHSVQTNPTLFIHSDLDPDVSNNQWGSFHHNQEGFVITTGANTGAGSSPTTIDNYIKFAPRGIDRMIIDGSGNVGIGTTAPDTKSEINLGTSDKMRLSYNAPTGSATDYAEFGVDSNGGLTITTVDASSETNGNITLSPDGLVDITADLIFTGSGTGLPYGCVKGVDETITCTNEDQWYQVTFDTEGVYNLTTLDTTNNEITISKTGRYLVIVVACFHTGVAHDFELMVKKNDGATDLEPHLYQSTAVAGQIENVSGTCLVSLTANDRIELWVMCSDAAGQDAIFDHVSLTCVMVGGG